jgi:glycosyltransferase involved in cell wall biosynthesis
MRILIDLQGLQNRSRQRGIGRYVLSFAKYFYKARADHEVFFIISALFPETIEDTISKFSGVVPRENFLIFYGVGPTAETEADLDPGNIWRLKVSEILYEKFICDLDPDVLLVGSIFEGSEDNSVISARRFYRRYLSVAILYDLIPLSDPEKYLAWKPHHDWYFGRIQSLARMDLALAISSSARHEAIACIGMSPDAVVNISSAASDEFVDALRHEGCDTDNALADVSQFGISRPYFMHMSAFEPRKNFEGLIRAFAKLPLKLRKNYQLVLTFKLEGNAKAKISELVKSLRLDADSVVLTGFVDDETLIKLYKAATLFVFPSFHEGFGLPALEAMWCGTAVIGSNVSSIPEVVGRSDALFDPHSIESIASKMEEVICDPELLQSLRDHARSHSRLFSWQATVEKAMGSIERAFARHSSAIRPDATQLITQHRSARIAQWIAGVDSPSPSVEDLRSAAICIARNESAALAFRAMARPGDALNWRIEGPFDSSYSLALLNRETARALTHFGHNVVLHSTEGPGDFDASPAFLEANADLAIMHERVEGYPHEDVDAVSRNLFPPRVNDMTSPLNALHHFAWEETGIPQDWIADFNQHLHMVTCLSEHVRKIMIDHGVTAPLSTSGCGVDHWEKIRASLHFELPAKAFRFLHVSSCFPRKGAQSLLQAFGKAFRSGDDVSLIIKTFRNPHNDVETQLAALKAGDRNFPHVHLIFDDLSDADLKALYECCDVMVGPSAAEGYGLPFAEAMLSGIPVITTAWGGQLDFCDSSNAWLVDYSFERAQSHFGLWGSAWAKVDVSALANAMLRASQTSKPERSAMAEAGRAQLLSYHKWTDVAARMLDARGSVSPESRSEIGNAGTGWLTTWNARCGIATYAAHLVRHFPGQSYVFAPYQDDASFTRPDEEFCRRSWILGKRQNDFSAVIRSISQGEIDRLIIQFNYGFYNHDQLAQLIESCADLGCTVVVVMHSTIDPTETMPGSELRHIVRALARCDRILVHSINDLNRLKKIGLVANVALFPHGVLASPNLPVDRGDGQFLLATYGFCLPHKGLAEVVEALALLRKRKIPAQLRMLNAEYPVSESRNLAVHLRDKINELGLADYVELDTSFADDKIVLEKLAEADVVIFAYQGTEESASGAVRYGLAARRPVAVTPQAIFDDVAGAVHYLPGVDATSIAAGLANLYAAFHEGAEVVQATAKNAEAWLKQHDFSHVARRLANMCTALQAEKPAFSCHFPASSILAISEVGIVEGQSVRSSERRGLLLQTPVVRLPRGRYQLTLDWSAELVQDNALNVEIWDRQTPLASFDCLANSATDFSVYGLDSHVFVRISVNKDARVSLKSVSIMLKSSVSVQ